MSILNESRWTKQYVDANAVFTDVYSKIHDHDISFKMYVKKASDLISNIIMKYHDFQPNEALRMINPSCIDRTKNKCVFIDIGANIGYFTFILALLGYKVYAFEAMPENQLFMYNTMDYIKYVQNIDVDITLLPFGLSNYDRNCSIYCPNDNRQDGFVFCNEMEAKNFFEERKSYYKSGYSLIDKNVEFKRLDDLLNDLQIEHIDTLKVDIEQFEPFVLPTIEKWFMLQKIDIFVAECWPTYKEGGTYEFFNLFTKYISDHYIHIDPNAMNACKVKQFPIVSNIVLHLRK